MKIVSWAKKHKQVLLLLGLSILIHNAWLTSGIYSFGDSFYEFPATVSEYVGNFEHSSWVDLRNIGSPNVEPYFYIFYFVRGLFAKIGLFYYYSSLVVFLLPIMVAAPLGAYALLRRLRLSKWLAFLGACVYSFNTYFFTIQTQHLPICVAYSLFPLTLWLLIKLLDKIGSRERTPASLATWFISCSIGLTLQIIAEPRIFIIVLPIYIAVALKHPSKALGKIKTISLLGLVLVLLNIYWIPPFILGSGDAIASTVNRSLFGNEFKTINTALTLFHPSWTGGEPVTFSLQPIPFYFWLYPVVICFGLYTIKNPRKKLFIQILIVAAIGWFLVKQAAPPLRLGYQWLFDNLPGFKLFRESTKFYILIAFTYMLLIPLAIESLISRYKYSRVKHANLIAPLTFALVAAVTAIISAPLINHTISGLFVSRHIPSEYEQLNKHILADKEFYRTAWLPTYSRWAVTTTQHPAIDLSGLFGSKWSVLLAKESNVQNSESSYRLLTSQLVDNPNAPELLKQSSVKYLIVPTHDKENDDDFLQYYGSNQHYFTDQLDKAHWLKKVDIGTKDLAVYENTAFVSYFNASANMNQVSSLENSMNYYKFSQSTLGQQNLDFISEGEKSADKIKSDAPRTRTTDLFNNLKAVNVNDGSLNVSQALQPANNATNSLYADTTTPQYGYQTNNGSVSWNVRRENVLAANGQSRGKSEQTALTATKLDPARQYSFGLGSKLYDLDASNGANRNLGAVKDSIKLYSSDASNLIKNGSFEKGTWTPKVEDCNNYDRAANISMSLDDSKHTDGKQSLKLGASKHTACTSSTPLGVNAGQPYRLTYQYQIKDGQQSGYDLIFNDAKHTVYNADQVSSTDSWHRLNIVFTPPAGATSMQLRLKGYPDDRNQKYAITYYDQVRVTGLKTEADVASAYVPKYEKQDLGSATSLTASIKAAGFGMENLIKNPSLENGLWEKEVGDCNAYDSNPRLGMVQSTHASDGNKSLELQATRHTACTGPASVGVQEGTDYLLSFDYQSPNSKQAGYHISFNDAEGTNLGQGIEIKGKDWQHFSKSIRVPYGATSMSLSVYSYSDDYGASKQINRYDNFALRRIPTVANRYYLVSQPKQTLVVPKDIKFTLSSPTKKMVHIKGATTGFYLNMSEAYNTGWRLELNDAKLAGTKAWLPNAMPTAVAANDHFNLNGFLNSWYVDPAKLCAQDSSACHKNADGSYDMEMVAEFTPQRYFYVGLIISGVTLVGCVTYLVVSAIRRRGQGSGEPPNKELGRAKTKLLGKLARVATSRQDTKRNLRYKRRR